MNNTLLLIFELPYGLRWTLMAIGQCTMTASTVASYNQAMIAVDTKTCPQAGLGTNTSNLIDDAVLL